MTKIKTVNSFLTKLDNKLQGIIHPTAYIFLISIIGISLRLFYFPYDIPITLDGVEYFWYAMDMSVLKQFPSGYNFPNNGWPSFVSVFFSLYNSSNFLDYMYIQRILSITISVLTIIPVYFLCRRFFPVSYSLIGATFVIFEPRLIINSLSGITESLYILLGATTLFFILSDKIKFSYLAFGFTALFTLVRYEGLLLIIPISIVFLLKFRKEKKIILKYLAALCIFLVIIVPMAYIRMETSRGGHDGLVSHTLAGPQYYKKILEVDNSHVMHKSQTANDRYGAYSGKDLIRDQIGFAGKWQIVSVTYNGNNSLIRISGTQLGAVGDLGSQGITSMTISADATNHDVNWFGLTKFGELLVYDKALSNTELTQVEEYLSRWTKGEGTRISTSPKNSFSPIQISDLYAWWDASDVMTIIRDENNRVSQWNDKSGYGHHLFQKTFESQPLWLPENQNGLGVIDTNGNKFLETNSWEDVSQPTTIVGTLFVNENGNESPRIWWNGRGVPLPTEIKQEIIMQMVTKSITNFTQYLGWVLIPIFVFFVPIGAILIFKNRNIKNSTLILVSIIFFIPALYAYSRGIQDTKYLFVMYPIFSILALHGIEKIDEKFKKTNILLVLVIIFIFFFSIASLEFKIFDYEHEREAFKIAELVAVNAKGINDYYPESKYYFVSELAKYEFPTLSSSVSTGPEIFAPEYFDSLEKFIERYRNQGLTHLVIDNSEKRPNFLRHIFLDEKSYPYLIKEFDSRENEFTYYVKVYRINYEKFDNSYNRDVLK